MFKSMCMCLNIQVDFFRPENISLRMANHNLAKNNQEHNLMAS